MNDAPASKVATLAELRAPVQQASLPVRADFFDAQGFDLMQRVAKAFAASTLVPKEYIGNLPNCMIALNMAQRMGADPLMVMQNLFVVQGRPGWSAQFLIATFNQCGRFSSLRYEFFGDKGTDGWGCRAWAIEKDTELKIVGSDITIGLTKKEGWYQKGGSKWQSIPQQMLMYRAASWLVRAYAPEIAMGLQTTEELNETVDAQQMTPGVFSVPDVDALRAEEPAAKTVDKETGELFTDEEQQKIKQRELIEAEGNL